ncbi:MAG: pilus assembly protein N-terminal domain-containing protein, partial [Gemmataceae bacterium]|nr:pilus assembly protein N-terminal domain-containing protein [Gemmataceae bacterium]
MKRTRNVLKLGAWGLFAAGLVAGPATAQPPMGEPIPPAAKPASRSAAGKAVIVAINSSQKLSMSTKKPISTVINEKETVARVQAIASDPLSVLVVGLQAGSTKVTLTDVDGATESYDVLVQLDIDAVKSVIRLTFPTANVTPIAAGTSTIVLTGNVAHPEDIEPILRVARGVLGSAGQGTTTEVFNAMTVGGVRQVQLDVTIAQVNRTEARFRNLNFIVNQSTISAGSILPALLQQAQRDAQLGGGGGVGLVPFALPAQPLPSTGTAGSNIVFGIVPNNINFLIQALRTEGVSKLLAEPKLVTMSGHPAQFLAGGQQAVLSPSSGINGPGVVLQDIGTSLTFLPIVLNNGKVFLEVEPVVRSVDNGLGINTAFGFTPGFSVQRVQTRVTMEAGQTFAIGGLIQTSVVASTTKVPLLGDLPFAGVLFSSVSHTEQEQEMVVLVTPYLVDPMDCKQAPCKLPGMETRKPDDFELYLESILEAPRGQRDVFPGKKYKAAWKNDPTAEKIPCGGDRGGDCGNGNCGSGSNGCANGACGAPA